MQVNISLFCYSGLLVDSKFNRFCPDSPCVHYDMFNILFDCTVLYEQNFSRNIRCIYTEYSNANQETQVNRYKNVCIA